MRAFALSTTSYDSLCRASFRFAPIGKTVSFAFGISRAEIVVKLVEVAEVVTQRMHGCVALILEIITEAIDVVLHKRTEGVDQFYPQCPARQAANHTVGAL